MGIKITEIEPYLIQRANFRNPLVAVKEGLDSLLSFNYMGSAEFEWGALPKSLKRIRASYDNYIYFEVNMPKNIVITVFCPKEHQKHIEQMYLNKLMKREYRLKEYSDFENLFVEPSKLFPNPRCRTDFWWDIGNDLMFWKKNQDFEKKFKEVIKPIN